MKRQFIGVQLAGLIILLIVGPEILQEIICNMSHPRVRKIKLLLGSISDIPATSAGMM